MRLWHKDLIDVLPRQQLLSQWRECCAIAKSIADEGTPNHILVNKITGYSQIHFIEYTNRILKEMSKRQYKVSENSYLRFVENLRIGKEYFYDGIMINKDIYPYWMNERYLKQCYYNLQEKYDCGSITEEEWNRIQNKIGKEVIDEHDKLLKENKKLRNNIEQMKKEIENNIDKEKLEFGAQYDKALSFALRVICKYSN